MQWHGAVVAVTGASRGIGEAVARAVTRRGARVGLMARSEDALARLLDDLNGRGVAVTVDVTDPHQVTAAIDRITDTLGPIDVLVNNAGVGAYGPVATTDLETFERLMRVNYLGTVYATKAVLPAMLSRSSGVVVTVASVAGRMAAPLEAAYSASKFAVVGFSEALAAEVAPRGVRVALVNPGPVATGFFEARGHPYARRFPRPISAEAVAAAVVSAVERGRHEVFVPRWLGRALVVKTLLPAVYRRGVARDVERHLVSA